jgi:hypothetical protein
MKKLIGTLGISLVECSVDQGAFAGSCRRPEKKRGRRNQPRVKKELALERAWGELVDAVEEDLHLQRPWRWPVPADERRGWSGWCIVLQGLAGAISS